MKVSLFLIIFGLVGCVAYMKATNPIGKNSEIVVGVHKEF